LNPSTARRAFLQAAAVASASQLLLPRMASAQAAYPNHTIKIFIGTPPGDTVDAWVRQLAAGLGTALGQAVIVDNRVGAHGMIVSNLGKAAEKDGYTLMVGTGGPMAINPALYGAKLTYDPLKDFIAIGGIGTGPLYLYANNDTKVTNLKEMVAYVKARPGKVSFGSGGTGTTQHLAMELLKKATGMDMQHVPYKGSPQVLQDVIGGQIAFAFDAGTSLLPQATSGKVRLLGVSTAKRSALTPDVPTLIEQGVPNFEVSVWGGLFAPAGTPPAIVARVEKEMKQVVSSPAFAKVLHSTAAEPWPVGGAELHAHLASEIERWKVVVKEAGVQPE
jgi:tripartite-type tricarboxylate transporter receptor subunit TctC